MALSKIKNTPGVNFSKTSGRYNKQKEVYNVDLDDLSKSKNHTMPRLNNGIIKFRNQEPRKLGEGFGGYHRHMRDL
jgi:hypothetical protein